MVKIYCVSPAGNSWIMHKRDWENALFMMGRLLAESAQFTVTILK
jgi:hypothetical protein